MTSTQNRFDGKTALQALTEAARAKILVLDGAMGTMIQQRKFSEEAISRRSVSPTGRAICAAITTC